MSRSARTFSAIAAMVMAAGTLGGAATAVAATHAVQTASEFGFAGYAFGTEVNVASTVESGRSALSTLGCTSQTGITHTNSVASVGLPGILTSGTVTTSVASQSTGTGIASTSSATTEGADLLGGLVTATAVQSVSTTSRDSHTRTFSISAAGTEFVGLTVAGVPITATPAPNTKIALPGVGYVELNQQSGSVFPASANLTVIGIHVVVTLSTPLAPVGTQIIVSDAHSSLGGPVSGLLDGRAYGASANVGNTIIAGPEFPEPLGCLGTHGVTRSNTGAAITIPGILTSGTVADTVEGVDNRTSVSAEVTSTVQGLNLLSGTVTATAVKADVTASGNPPTLVNKSTFLDLTVAGFPGITGTPAPNTKLSLAGIGTLWLNRQIETTNSITVIMIQLIVKVANNPLGLQPGTVVNVAYASASIR
jgi:hypothetical protein